MLYLKGSAVFTENEISMMCYIAGETRYPATARYLLELTYDPSIRIRASAVNALGKINYESSDTSFISKVANRLKELYNEKPEGMLYRKDIAFALSNYRTSVSYEILFEMLDDPYWGVRLASAQGLKRLGNISSNITGDLLAKLSPVSLIAFIHSLEQLSDDELMKIYHDVSAQYNFNDEAVIYNMISLMKRKHNDIISEEIKKLESKTKLKIR
jgi:HEAT repeat protein